MQTESSWAVQNVRGLIRTALAAILVVVVAEGIARIALGDDDDWKFWRIVVGERIDLLEARPTAPEVLFIGDSTAASNLVPIDFIEASGHTAYNLGTRGNLIGSFEPTMLDAVLPALHNQPKALVVSFSPRNYDDNAFFNTVVDQVNGSLFARSARGEFIWGDLFHLARVRHRIRARLPHQANDPTLDAAHGWQPWSVTSVQRRPNAKTKIARAPWARRKPRRKRGRRRVPEKLNIVTKVAAYAAGRPVIWLLPPMGKPSDRRLIEDLKRRAPPNVHLWDYSNTAYKRAEGAHLRDGAAHMFSKELGRRFAKDHILASEVTVP